jgi:DNA-binding LacI/PurR family transcriptional regulator
MSVVDQRRGQPTLEEVARLAGVSRATVSRVVNNSPRVSPEARAAVDRAISQLRYIPNRAARSLVTRRTDTVALVVSEPEARVFSDPFLAAMVRGISRAIAVTDLQLVLLMAHDAREHEKVERYLTQGHADGVMLMSLHGDDSLPRVLTSRGVPVVLSGRPRGGEPVPYVDADNRGGAALAVEYLARIGRSRIAAITGPLDMTAAVDRYDGYADGLARAGMRLRKGLVAHGDFSERSGERAMAALLRRNADVDAVFVSSDPMAIGALRALAAAGRRVPDDVAVVGFDDIPSARYAQPPLTTVRQPMEQMARAMAALAVEQIAGGEPGEPRVLCPTTLVRRDSA